MRTAPRRVRIRRSIRRVCRAAITRVSNTGCETVQLPCITSHRRVSAGKQSRVSPRGVVCVGCCCVFLFLCGCLVVCLFFFVVCFFVGFCCGFCCGCCVLVWCFLFCLFCV